MEGADRDLLHRTLPRGAANVRGDIWKNKSTRENKIGGMLLIKIDESGARCPFAVEKAEIRGDIKATTQSLD